MSNPERDVQDPVLASNPSSPLTPKELRKWAKKAKKAARLDRRTARFAGQLEPQAESVELKDRRIDEQYEPVEPQDNHIPGSYKGGQYGAADDHQNLQDREYCEDEVLTIPWPVTTPSHMTNQAADGTQIAPAFQTVEPSVADVEPIKEVEEPTHATWEDEYQQALNASILSGGFENLRIVAFSRRVRGRWAGAPRTMYANSALVKHALAKAHLLFAEEAAGATQGRDLEEHVGDYPYSDDSDLENEDMQDSAFNQQDGCTDERDTPRKSDGEHGRPSPGVINKESTTTPTDDFVSVSTSDEVDQYTSDLEELNGRLSATSPDTSCMRARPAAGTEPAVQRFDMVPTVVLKDTAYQTWRTFVFYAYTHRISFAPLRSQGLDPVPSGVAHGLPICSPKSMYRLAVTYGNAELQQLARSDIASKLSTKNALTELFSGFTARYPEIQDMVLDFVLAHLQHPNITSCLPYWVGRFARGELQGCAGTFERFIQRLASAATAAASQGGGMGSKF